MGKGGSQGLSPEVQSEMASNQTALVNIAQQQNANAQQIYRLAEPGFNTAENFYQALASGDPNAIMRVLSPSAQQSQEAAQGAKENILKTTPAGGEKNLALANVDTAEAMAVGNTASSAVANAPNALAGLAGQGIGESISQAGTAIQGTSAASSSAAEQGQLQIQNAQLQMEQKGQSLGALGTLAQGGAAIAGGAMGGGGWEGALAALAAF